MSISKTTVGLMMVLILPSQATAKPKKVGILADGCQTYEAINTDASHGTVKLTASVCREEIENEFSPAMRWATVEYKRSNDAKWHEILTARWQVDTRNAHWGPLISFRDLDGDHNPEVVIETACGMINCTGEVYKLADNRTNGMWQYYKGGVTFLEQHDNKLLDATRLDCCSWWYEEMPIATANYPITSQHAKYAYLLKSRVEGGQAEITCFGWSYGEDATRQIDPLEGTLGVKACSDFGNQFSTPDVDPYLHW